MKDMLCIVVALTRSTLSRLNHTNIKTMIMKKRK